MKVYQRVLQENVAYIFECPMTAPATEELNKQFTTSVQQYVQNKFLNRGYNLYVESNLDMLGVVVVLDINNLPATEVVDLQFGLTE